MSIRHIYLYIYIHIYIYIDKLYIYIDTNVVCGRKRMQRAHKQPSAQGKAKSLMGGGRPEPGDRPNFRRGNECHI